MEQIKVSIASTGEVSYEVSGHKGRGCKALTAAIDAMGTVKESKNTAEYCELPNAQQQRIGG